MNLNIVADKCKHFGGVKKICPFPNNTTILEICYDVHCSSHSSFSSFTPDFKSKKDSFCVQGSQSPAPSTNIMNLNSNLPEVDTSLCVSDIVQFGIKTLYIQCKQEETLLDTVAKAAEEATHSAANAFELLMSKGRVFPDKKLQDVEQDLEPSVSEETESEAPFPLTAQTARGVVDCVECEKPRVYYCKTKLSGRQSLLLITSISEKDYTCGSPLSEHELLKTVYMRTALTCGSHVEFPYYSSDFARFDVCSHCGDTDASVDAELKKHFRTVLPICKTCEIKGKKTVTKRPYGKVK